MVSAPGGGDGDMATLPPAKNLSIGIVAPGLGLERYPWKVELAVDEENTVSVPSTQTVIP